MRLYLFFIILLLQSFPSLNSISVIPHDSTRIVYKYKSYEKACTLKYDDMELRNGMYANYIINNKIVFKNDLSSASTFHEDLARVVESPENYIERNCPNESIASSCQRVNDDDGYVAVFKLCGKIQPMKAGYINRDGKMIIDFQYETACSFSDGLACVGNIYKEDDELFYLNKEKYGFIDKSGKVVIPFMYDGVRSFINGLALVTIKHPCPESKFCDKDMMLIRKDGSLRTKKYTFIRNWDGHSSFLFVSDKNRDKIQYNYVTLDGKIICRNCNGLDVINNRACVDNHPFIPKEEFERPTSCSTCRIMNEKGEFLSRYSLRNISNEYLGDYAHVNGIDNTIDVVYDNIPWSLRTVHTKFILLKMYMDKKIFDWLTNNGYLIFIMGQGREECSLPKAPVFKWLVTTNDGEIVWPPGWNDPCTDTGGIVIWPEGSCQRG